MKVLWINEKANFCGGAEHYIYNTVKHLNNKGLTSSLLYNPNEECDGKFFEVFEDSFPMVLIKEQIKELSPDVIYIHQLDDMDILEQILDLNIPVVRFIHDHKLFCLREHKYTTLSKNTCTSKVGIDCYKCLGFVHKDSSSILGLDLKSLSHLEKEQTINKRIDKFIVASEYMKEHLILHEFDENKIVVNPLYSDYEGSTKKQTQTNKSKKLLFVGQLISGKGVDILLDAMKDIPLDFTLDIVGEGAQEEVFKSYSSRLNLDKRVNFLGKRDKSQLEKHYSSAFALVIPSRSPETFNLTGIEALRCGTPVVATDVGGITQWLKDDLNGLLANSNDAVSLSSKINDLVIDDNLHQRLCFNAFKSTLYDFRSGEHIDNLINTLKF